MNLTSQAQINNRWKKIRTDSMGSDASTKIECPSKEPDSCAPRLNTQAINTKELNRPFTFKQIVRRACRRALNAFLGLFSSVVTRTPYFHFLKGTQGSQNPCLFRYWFWQTFLGLNRTAYWPIHFTSKINQSKNILVGIDSTPSYEPGCCIQGLGPVRIGNYTKVAANVGIISANHDFTDLQGHSEKLGVTIGSPAKVVRKFHPDDCVSHDLKRPYHGYVRHEDFADFRKRRLSA